MGIKPYPTYKASGFDWLGEIPERWQVVRVKFLSGHEPTPVQTGPFGAQLHAEDYQDEGIPLILIRNVRNNKIDDTEIPRISEEDALRLSMYRVKEGDIVFSRVGSIGRIALITGHEEGWLISGQMLRLRLGSSLLLNNYLVYTLSSDSILTYPQLASVGSTRESINTDILKNIPLPIPYLDEQQAIVDFLDRETEIIDTLITKKRELIERLHEKRTALINQVIAKGLHPLAPMKDCGIEWLGQIPAHWEIIRLKFKCEVKARLGWRGLKASEYVDDGYIFLSTPNIKGDEIDFVNVNYISEERYFESPEIMLREGYVLLAKDGSTLGITNVVRNLPHPATVNSSIAVLKPGHDIDSVFLYYYLSSNHVQNLIYQLRGGMGVPHLFQADIREFLLLIPPLSEQQEIAVHLDKQTSILNGLVNKVELAIETLQEYRTALISAVVTGKIDVRNYEFGEA